MPTITLDDGLRLAYQESGQRERPTLVFSNSLGTDMRMWAAQAEALGMAFRIVCYDTRGHGQSGVPTGPTTLERLGRDVLALLDHLGVGRAHICGLSLGGLTAQWLALTHPERVERLVLANTAARIGSIELWDARIAAVRADGMAAISAAAMERFFSPHFRAARPDIVASFRAMLEATDPGGYTAACAALRNADLRPQLRSIVAPTLVIAGSLDAATPPQQAEELHAGIPKSRLALIDGAAHLSNVEQPEAFGALLERFLGDGPEPIGAV